MPIANRDNVATGIVGIAVDLSGEGAERRRRRESEMVLSEILKEIDQPVSLLDNQMRILMTSSAFCEAAAIGSEDALLRKLDEVIASPPAPRLTSGEEYTWEGAAGHLFKSRHLTYINEGSQFGISISEDISREESLLAAVKAARKVKDTILEGLTEPAAFLGDDARIEQMNKAFLSMLGVAKETVAGDSLTHWVSPGFKDRLIQAYAEASAGGEMISGESILRNSTGAAILVKFELRAVTENTATPRLVLLQVTDWGDPAERVESRRHHEISDVDGVILEILAVGEGNARIAQSLCLSRQGLDYRLKALRRQMDAASRGALVGRAYALGILDPSTWPPRLSHRTP
ncbi:PAS domain-containing protein [Streptomyces sp. NPDC051577]|uniref:PAS domain-containing protein n=1 Tax=Streptomyces sp. NPDC051577 TaxID=3155166 RepID=UPI0034220F0D